MSDHELKVESQYFDALASGLKNFELRRDDRGFAVGDSLRLREIVYLGKCDGVKYTGREVQRTVRYILTGPCHGLQNNYVILGLNWPVT